jgi:hypothetical protein
MTKETNGAKPWYLSLTILAALATIAQGATHEMTGVLDPYLPAWLKTLLMTITGGLAIFGRIRAATAIGAAASKEGGYVQLGESVRMFVIAAGVLIALVTLNGCDGFRPSPMLTNIAQGVKADLLAKGADKAGAACLKKWPDPMSMEQSWCLFFAGLLECPDKVCPVCPTPDPAPAESAATPASVP